MKFTNVSSYYGLGDVGYDVYNFLPPIFEINKEINYITSQLIRNIDFNNSREIECKDFVIGLGIENGNFIIGFRDTTLPFLIDRKYMTFEKKDGNKPYFLNDENYLVDNYNTVENTIKHENNWCKICFKIPLITTQIPQKIKATEMLEYKTHLLGGHHYTPIEYEVIDKHMDTKINIDNFKYIFLESIEILRKEFKEKCNQNKKFINENGDLLKALNIIK